MSGHLLKRLRTLSPVDAAGAATAAAMVLAFTFGLLGPMALRQQHAAGQRQQALRQQQQQRATATAVHVLAQRIAQTKSQIAAVPVHILPAAALNGRLAALVQSAAECGLTINDLKPASPVVGQRFTAIPIVLTGSGGYIAAARFFELLNQRFSDVGVCGFRMDAISHQGGAEPGFQISLHWLAQPASIPSGPVQTATAGE